jgi:hypothetical protein
MVKDVTQVLQDENIVTTTVQLKLYLISPQRRYNPLRLIYDVQQDNERSRRVSRD